MSIQSYFFFLFSLIISTPIFAQQPKDTLPEMQTFQLGQVVLTAPSTKDKLTAQDFLKYNKLEVAQSLQIIPSVNINYTGSRNESSVYVRGFDIRSVPIYVDGIPIYVPYDGYVDLSRFTTADLSSIEVSKGYSSILYGPNTIGGTINMISTKPQSDFELKTKVGFLSGEGFNNFASIGSKQNKFYVQSVFSQLDKSYLPLSKDFEVSPKELDLERDNSYRKDRKFTAKIGFTPNETDEYAISYINQRGEKGNPTYIGTDPTIRVRYWQWPYWNKESLYFISKTQLTPKTYIKSRAFLDIFKNKLKAFDNASYNSQTRPSSFTSYYNDETLGFNVESGTAFETHTIQTALHFKRDFHQQNNEGKTPEKMQDNIYSFGVEDVYTAFQNLKIIAGASYNLRKSVFADNVNDVQSNGAFNQFPKNENAAINTQVSTVYTVNQKVDLSLTAAYKTRFATMKDRYSYRSGTSLPNPDLKSEQALNMEIASNYSISEVFTVKPEIFYSRLFNTMQLISNVQPGLSQVQNTGKSQFYGGDVSVIYKPLEAMNFLANYTFIKRENISNPDLLFTDVPEHHLFVAMEYEAVKNLLLNVNSDLSSKRYSTNYGLESPKYLVFNSQLSYKLNNGLKFEIGVNNIFDKNYTLTEGYPEPGRNGFVSMFYNFKN